MFPIRNNRETQNTGFVVGEKPFFGEASAESEHADDLRELFCENDSSKPNWNVISEGEFKGRVLNVFSNVANALRNTLGPYGSTTIIEKYGEMHITKDGWQVLKSIHFANNIDNNILMMLLRISQQVVLKVGDGSTSSVIAANSILDELNNNKVLNSIRPKELMEALNKRVAYISSNLLKNARQINKDTYDEIYKIAYISTNGDDTIANMIKDIYTKTHNPAIEFVQSKTDKTEYDIIDGYTANITYLDTIFATDDSYNCEIKRPYYLMFDYKIDMDTLDIIHTAVSKAVDEGRRLVVIAPNYDKQLLEYIRKNVNIEMRSMGSSSVVYARVSLISNMSQTLYNDFAVMTGGDIIRESYLESDTFMNDITSIYMGETEHATIGQKSTFISGFYNRNEDMYKKIVMDANAQYKVTEEDYMNRGLVDTKLNEMKQRISKLTGSAGVIRIGGYSTLEKKANFDLVEDAVKACESAFMYGYNIGGSMIIPWYLNTLKDSKSTIESEIDHALYNAFTSVFKTIYYNKYKTDNADVFKIIHDMVSSTEPVSYDIIKEEITTDIINSCITDIEILKASISIVSLLISSNQYISINMTANEV